MRRHAPRIAWRCGTVRSTRRADGLSSPTAECRRSPFDNATSIWRSSTKGPATRGRQVSSQKPIDQRTLWKPLPSQKGTLYEQRSGDAGAMPLAICETRAASEVRPALRARACHSWRRPRDPLCPRAAAPPPAKDWSGLRSRPSRRQSEGQASSSPIVRSWFQRILMRFICRAGVGCC